MRPLPAALDHRGTFMDEWIEGLVSKLKSSSTRNWAAGKSPYRAMPSTIVRVIKDHSAEIDPKVLRSYYKAARSHLDQLVQQNDLYAATFRRAADHLSQLLKWKRGQLWSDVRGDNHRPS
jgi:hypothetical protein